MKLFELFGVIDVDNKSANEGIEETDKKASGLGDKFKKVGSGVAKAGKVMATGLGIVAGAATVATKEIAETTDRIDKMSQNIGFSKEGFQEWDFILSQNGSSIDGLDRSMATLSKQVTDGAEGSKTAIEAFAKLGLNVENLADLSQEELFEKTIEGLQGMEEGAERTALANQLLGGTAKEMGALLNLTSDDVAGLKDQAHDLGLVMSDDMIKAGVDMTDQMDVLKRTLVGVAAEALVPLMPAVMELMKAFVDILPPIMEFVKPLIEKLVPVITTIIERLLPVFTRLLDAIMPVLDPLIDLFLDLVVALLPIIEALLPLIEVILPPLVMLIEALSPILSGLAKILSGTLATSVTIITEQFRWLFDILEPVFELLKKIGEVAGAAYGQVGDVVGGFGGKITDSWKQVGDFWGGLLPKFDVGSRYVPDDMVAMVHKGEMIVPASENPYANPYKSTSGIVINVNDAQFIDNESIDRFTDMLAYNLRSKGVEAT